MWIRVILLNDWLYSILMHVDWILCRKLCWYPTNTEKGFIRSFQISMRLLGKLGGNRRSLFIAFMLGQSWWIRTYGLFYVGLVLLCQIHMFMTWLDWIIKANSALIQRHLIALQSRHFIACSLISIEWDLEPLHDFICFLHQRCLPARLFWIQAWLFNKRCLLDIRLRILALRHLDRTSACQKHCRAVILIRSKCIARSINYLAELVLVRYHQSDCLLQFQIILCKGYLSFLQLLKSARNSFNERHDVNILESLSLSYMLDFIF